MASIKGTFSGRITKQSTIPLTDKPNHELSIVEVSGTQKSDDPLWNNSKITYWGVTDLIDGKGSQRGYYNNVHADGGRDWGTFEGKVTMAGGVMTVEGTYSFADGDGDYLDATGSGRFRTVMKSKTELECSWDGVYELAHTLTR